MSDGDRDWTIRPFQEGDEFGILELFNEVFAAGNPDFVPRTMPQWRWQFEQNPSGHQTYVADEGGRIVGQYTGVPTVWRLPSGTVLGTQALDTCVASHYRRSLRRKGLFLTLADEWFAHYGCPERSHIVYGFPNPQAFRIGTRRVGYLPVRCPVSEHALPVAAAASLKGQGIDLIEVEDFGREVDELDAALAAQYEMAAVRGSEYLNWRYAKNPNTRYQILRAESAAGHLRGYLVYTLGWHGDRKDIAPVVDWLIEPGDLEVWKAMIGMVGRQAQAAGLRDLLAWAPPHHQHRKDLEVLEFVGSDSRFNLCIRIFTDAFDLAYAIEHWTVLMGDSDIY